MTISEPTTLITDYVLAAISIVFGIALLRARTHRGTLLWGIGFLVLAAAGLTGGTFHGFRLMMSDGEHSSLWNITMLLIGAGAGTMISAALSSDIPWSGRNTRWLSAGLLLSVGGAVIQLSQFAIHPSFNHNDLCHSVLMFAFYCFYRGARLTA